MGTGTPTVAATRSDAGRDAGLARFDGTERAVHWTTAALVLTLLATGAALYAGESMKLPSLSCAASNDSTSFCSAVSLSHALEINDERCPGSYSRARLKTALICCQRSGVISFQPAKQAQA